MLSRFPNTDIRIIPIGVDVNYFKPINYNDGENSIVFCGNMASSINIYSILYFYKEIYPLIRKEVQNLKMYIVGRDPPIEIAKLSSNDSVIVTGNVPDVRPYLSRGKVVVVPQLWASGMKIKTLEALAMGKAIVATPQAVEGINAIHGKHLMVADNPNDFAQHVIKLLRDEKLRDELGKNARKLAEEYSWEKLTYELNRIFEEIVHENK